MKKFRPSDDASKKAKINMVKVGGEDIDHVDEELSKKSGKTKKVMTQTWKKSMDLTECLWHHGEHEPEGDPEEWIDRVADEVAEKRLQKMQVLKKPEGSAKGISYLTTRYVHDWRKKPYQLAKTAETISTWRVRFSQEVVVAREVAFAEGKR